MTGLLDVEWERRVGSDDDAGNDDDETADGTVGRTARADGARMRDGRSATRAEQVQQVIALEVNGSGNESLVSRKGTTPQPVALYTAPQALHGSSPHVRMLNRRR